MRFKAAAVAAKWSARGVIGMAELAAADLTNRLTSNALKPPQCGAEANQKFYFLSLDISGSLRNSGRNLVSDGTGESSDAEGNWLRS